MSDNHNNLRPQGERPQGERPQIERPQGDRPKEETPKKEVSDEGFFIEAEKTVNRLIKQYEQLVEICNKHKVINDDINYMFAEIKKQHESSKRSCKFSDKGVGFSFKK